jgi:hypothetical protein
MSPALTRSVREIYPVAPNFLRTTLICQDRLGTNIRKVLIQKGAFICRAGLLSEWTGRAFRAHLSRETDLHRPLRGPVSADATAQQSYVINQAPECIIQRERTTSSRGSRAALKPLLARLVVVDSVNNVCVHAFINLIHTDDMERVTFDRYLYKGRRGYHIVMHHLPPSAQMPASFPFDPKVWACGYACVGHAFAESLWGPWYYSPVPAANK